MGNRDEIERQRRLEMECFARGRSIASYRGTTNASGSRARSECSAEVFAVSDDRFLLRIHVATGGRYGAAGSVCYEFRGESDARDCAKRNIASYMNHYVIDRA